MSLKDRLLLMLDSGNDSALLRFSLAGEMLKEGDAAVAVEHLERAVAMQADYSAAWKLLGKACTSAGRTDRAMDAYRQGIQVATERGDVQAAREMQVFLKRLERDS